MKWPLSWRWNLEKAKKRVWELEVENQKLKHYLTDLRNAQRQEGRYP